MEEQNGKKLRTEWKLVKNVVTTNLRRGSRVKKKYIFSVTLSISLEKCTQRKLYIPRLFPTKELFFCRWKFLPSNMGQNQQIFPVIFLQPIGKKFIKITDFNEGFVDIHKLNRTRKKGINGSYYISKFVRGPQRFYVKFYFDRKISPSTKTLIVLWTKHCELRLIISSECPSKVGHSSRRSVRGQQIYIKFQRID